MRAATALAAAVLMLCLGAGGARAGLTDWSVSPLKLDLGDGWTFHAGGSVNLTAYTARQSAGFDRTGVSASSFFYPRIEKLFSNGWEFGVRSAWNVYHDTLSGDDYGNNFFQKAYLFLQTPYGRVELGQQDGAAYHMAITGPLVADEVALDDADIVFFRDPATGEALTNIFEVRSAVFASQNYAKISYYTPRLFGVRIGASYTPHTARDVLPFVSAGPHVANRQDNLFETAINYTGFFGATSVGAYAGLAAGNDAQPTGGHDGLFDWSIGTEVDHDFGGTTLAVGGAYRQSNGYTFDVGEAFRTGTTHTIHASTKLSRGKWLAGFEYATGAADAEAAMPRLVFTGYEASIGYVINSNLRLTGGWQHERFTRSTGAFYNGGPAVEMDAGFLYLHFHV